MVFGGCVTRLGITLPYVIYMMQSSLDHIIDHVRFTAGEFRIRLPFASFSLQARSCRRIFLASRPRLTNKSLALLRRFHGFLIGLISDIPYVAEPSLKIGSVHYATFERENSCVSRLCSRI